WDTFDPDTQVGWRSGGYLQNGIVLSSAPNSTFETAGGKVHSDIVGTQVLDAWGRPIILQQHPTKGFRLISAGQGFGLENGTVETDITEKRDGDDRVLYLENPTPSEDINPSCSS
ncbi:MAG: hypothetical protein GQ569_11195, partial [Methylococcaceae bacterium]|nr:hypothetical protein [Methylococcaceae bacterium]